MNFYYIYIYIYIYICFFFYLAALVAPRGLFSSCGKCRCGAGASYLQWLLLLWSMGCRHVGFSSCGMRSQ